MILRSRNGSRDLAVLEAGEREVLELWSRGASTAEIVARLHLSEDAVVECTRSIFRKLDVHSRVEAVARGLGWGLVAHGRRAV